MATDLYGYTTYLDARGALAWFRALGFTVLREQDDETGELMHAEVRLGNAVIMIGTTTQRTVGTPTGGEPTGHGFYLCTDDVDGLFVRAVSAGSQILLEPEDTPWGGRRARVLDPGGVEWSFGTYRPGGVDET